MLTFAILLLLCSAPDAEWHGWLVKLGNVVKGRSLASFVRAGMNPDQVLAIMGEPNACGPAWGNACGCVASKGVWVYSTLGVRVVWYTPSPSGLPCSPYLGLQQKNRWHTPANFLVSGIDCFFPREVPDLMLFVAP